MYECLVWCYQPLRSPEDPLLLALTSFNDSDDTSLYAMLSFETCCTIPSLMIMFGLGRDGAQS